MIGKCKARNPVTGHYEYGIVLGRSRDGYAYLILFDDGAKGWVSTKFVFAKVTTEKELEQTRLI